MDPVLGSIIGGAMVALIAGVFGIRQARVLESERSKAAANTAAIDTIRVQVEGWKSLDEAHRAELDRKDHEIERLQHAVAEERAVAEAFSAKVDRLHEEVEFCRTHHTGGTEP